MPASERTAFERKLFRWGSFCARNQVRVLLLNCVVLCSVICLVDPFDHLPWRRPAFASWWTADASLEVSDDPICLRAIPAEREWRMLQLKVVKDAGHEHGVLDRGLLHTALQMETAAASVVAANTGNWSCLRIDAACLTASPLVHWNHSESDLLSDRHLLKTLSCVPAHYTTPHGLRLPVEATLASYRPGPGFTVYSAKQLITSWLLHRPMSVRAKKEGARRNVMRDALYGDLARVGGDVGQLQSVRTKPKAFVIKRKTVSEQEHAKAKREAGTVFTVAYSLVALYIVYRVRRLDRVHSRSGLLFTAAVSMAASGLLSLSVCKLLGFSVDSIPWKFIPLLIAVLAADNAMMLTEAVMSTSVELPIPDRIGEGLAKVGPSILYALAVEHVLLLFCFILLPVRSVREMTLLAAVALKADAVMQVTLFLTILSIDIQRLELADLLRQGSPSLEGASSSNKKSYLRFGSDESQWTVVSYQILSGCKERLARTVCFLAVFCSNLWLYGRYGSQYFAPAFCSDLSSIALNHASSAPSRLWSLLAPASETAVRVVVEAPVLFWPYVYGGQPSGNWLFGGLAAVLGRQIVTVVVPVAAATSSVYLLLLYMLKDGDLLAAEKDRAAKEKQSKKNALLRHIGPRIVGQVFELPSDSDVEALAISNNGTVLSWSLLDESLVLTRFETLSKAHGSEPARKGISLGGLKGSIRHLCVNHDARVCAVANAVGEVSVWSLADQVQLEFPPEDGPHGAKRTVVALFADPRNGAGTPPKTGRGEHGRLQENAHIFALFSDGALVTWDCAQRSVSTLIPRIEAAQQGKVHVFAIMPPPSQHSSWPVVVRIAEDVAHFWTCHHRSEWTLSTKLQLPAKEWTVTAVSYAAVTFGSDRRALIALGTQQGRLGLWDSDAGSLITELGGDTSSIRRISLAPCSRSRCPCPAEVLCDSFLLIYSTSTQAFVKKCLLPLDARLCLCARLARRSLAMTRSSSGTSLKDTPASDGSVDYPLSPHAIRSAAQTQERRNRTERETSGDSANGVTVTDAQWGLAPPSPGFQRAPSPARSEEPASWAHDMRLVEFGDVQLDPNGFWDLVGNYMLAGLRRPLEAQGRKEEWQLFSIDLSNSRCQLDCVTTSLSSFAPKEGRSEESGGLRRRHAPAEKKQPESKMPFSRIRCWASTSDCQHLVVSYGSAIAILSPTIGSKGISPSNDQLLAFLSSLGQKASSQ